MTTPSSSKGGASPYQRGARYEREVASELRARGYFVIRSPGSRSAVDLIAWRKDEPRPLWIQCKLAGRIRPAERQAVIDLADEFGGKPVLSFKRPGQKFAFSDLDTREEFTP